MHFLSLLVLIMARLTSASILERIGFAAVDSQNLLGKHAAMMRRQTTGNVTCRLSMATDIWSSCASVLSQYNITLDYFMAGNPSIGADCSNFVPGDTYCISLELGQPIPVSTNGMCGSQQNFTSTCIGSQWGDCCGVGGYCGTGEDYCGLGNCQEGTCDGAPIPYSTDGLCGSQNGWVECPPKFGLCCSEFGFCGNGTDFCSGECQSGPCINSTATTSTTTTSANPTQTPGSVSADGTCGYAGGLICKGSSFGDCCSAAGFCGSSQYACLDILGCQLAFGTCNITGYLNATSTTSTTTTTSSTTSKSTSTFTSTSSTPIPTQSGLAANCNHIEIAESEEYCSEFAVKWGITTAELYTWNPVLGANGENCGTDFWAEEGYCVGVDN